MRCLNKNKQTLYYARFVENVAIYAVDSDGNIITTDVDGQRIPVEESYVQGYTAPIRFRANLGIDSGYARYAEYGLDPSDYNAIISADKGEFDFDEQTLIWHKTKPKLNADGTADPTSADYKVIAVKTSLNEERFVLKRRTNADD